MKLSVNVLRLPVLVLSLGLFSMGAAAADITGAGASFPAPLYARWADAYQKETGKRVNYQSIGSGGGIKQITAKTVDFGASDMPLKTEVLDKDGLLQFPTVIGGVVLVVNVPGVLPGQLQLTGPVIADIYLGKITQWNDKAIGELNPGLKLPDSTIAVIRRADGSGTSFIFTNYLSKVSPEWKEKVGEGTAVQWPTGMGGKGNEGVSAFLQRIPSSITYVEYAYAKQNKLAWTKLKNAAGTMVSPDDVSFKAAAAGADWSKSSFGEILTNAAGKDAWPITGATFVLMQKVSGKPEQSEEAIKFFDWAFAKGGKLAGELDYVELPESLIKNVRASWSNIKDTTGKSIIK